MTKFLHTREPADLLQKSLSIDIMTLTTHPTTGLNATMLRIIQCFLMLRQALHKHELKDSFKLVIELTLVLNSDLLCLISTKQVDPLPTQVHHCIDLLIANHRSTS